MQDQAQSLGRKKYPQPGKMVVVNGRKMHLNALGQGNPTVVLEAAIWDFSLTWSLVQPAVAKFARCVAYDRLGLGWSDPATGPRSGDDMLTDLRSLLTNQFPPPYILVGQSFSALLARLYAYRFPSEICGLVLLDPAHEDQVQRFPAPIREMFGSLKESQIGQLQRVKAIIQEQGPQAAPPLMAIPPSFPPEIAEQYRWQSACEPSRLDAMLAELEGLEITQEQVRAAGAPYRGEHPLGDLPLVVLSHGQPASVPGMPDDVNQAYERAWQELHTEIAAMSTRGKRLVAEKSGHMIHHDQPELVVEVIRQTVEMIHKESA